MADEIKEKTETQKVSEDVKTVIGHLTGGKVSRTESEAIRDAANKSLGGHDMGRALGRSFRGSQFNPG